jgi:mannose-6-phosphate isomerase-like protein (cupin superfamily)
MEHFIDVRGRALFAVEKMKKSNLFSTAHLFCDLYCFEPGQEQVGHRHADADKIYYVIDGTGRITVGDQERDVVPGTIVLAPQGELHQVRNTGATRLTLLVFMAPKPA